MPRIRYYAAAAAAAGVREEHVALEDIADGGGTLGSLLRRVGDAHAAAVFRAAVPEPPAAARSRAAGIATAPGSAGAPRLDRVISRSSFLVNEVNERDLGRPLAEDDVVDVLPPFAGG
ncbi:MAG: MoaD/ThiS family protein [Arthrobacter sp.]|uniref:MoaD/ThiS family protein n=1 Tax=Arthrobacter sp. TaxID=1667 RepID=UPI00347BC01E